MMRILAAAILIAAVSSAAAEDTYVIDGTHTTPMYEIRHMGMSLQRGFFTETMGKVTLDRTAKTGKIDVVVSTGSVTTSSRILNDVLKRDDWFSTEQYPAMRYVASDLVFEGDVPVAANGQLTLLGVTRPVTLAISGFHCGTHALLRRAMCAAEATATIRRSEFGMTTGIPAVAGDEVRIVIPVEAMQRIAVMRRATLHRCSRRSRPRSAHAQPAAYRIDAARTRAEFDDRASRRPAGARPLRATCRGASRSIAAARAGSIELDIPVASVATGWDSRDRVHPRRDDVRRRAVSADPFSLHAIRVRERAPRSRRRRPDAARRHAPGVARGAADRVRPKATTAMAARPRRQARSGAGSSSMDSWWPLIGDEVELTFHVTAVRE